MMRRAVVVAGLLVAGVAHADESQAPSTDAARLRTEGEAFAQRADYAGAIERFRAADKLEPRASNACLIGLAYLRRDLYSQAELFLRWCRLRTRPADPLPEWIEDAEQQLTTALAAADVTRIDFNIQPSGVAAVIRLAAFPDDAFDPHTMHLPAGSHAIEITAPGFKPVRRSLELIGRGNRRVDIMLERDVAGAASGPRRPDPSRRRWSNRLLVSAGVAAAGGVVFHALAVGTRANLADPADLADYRRHEPTFDRQRAAALSLYGVATIAASVGLYLRLRPGEAPVQVGAGVSGDGAAVWVGWQR